MVKPLSNKLTPRRLSPQQQKFVDFLFAGLTPAEAAKQAGYASGKGPTYDAHKAASVLISKPHVAAAIKQGRAKQRELRDATRPDLCRAEIIGDIDELMDLCRDAGPGSWQAQTRKGLIELKGKILGVFTEKVELGLDEKFIRLLEEGRERARQRHLDAQQVDLPTPEPLALPLPPAGEEGRVEPDPIRSEASLLQPTPAPDEFEAFHYHPGKDAPDDWIVGLVNPKGRR
jgi:hypothetical protein